MTALGVAVIEVSVGSDHTCARKTDGTLWCWGKNTDGQLGIGNTTASTVPVQVTGLAGNVTSVSVGNGHTCARKTDGTLWCWGSNFDGELGIGNLTSRFRRAGITPAPARATAPCGAGGK